jgi:hypothetical protein
MWEKDPGATSTLHPKTMSTPAASPMTRKSPPPPPPPPPPLQGFSRHSKHSHHCFGQSILFVLRLVLLILASLPAAVAESTAKRAENTATTKFTPASRTRTSHPSTTPASAFVGDAETDLYPGRICWFSNSDACKKKKARNFMLGVFGAAKAFNMVTRTAQFDVLP